MLVCRPRRQAGARPGHRPRQQRAPRPRRAVAEAVAARSADRRTQPHPSDRIARRGDRGSRALPLVLRLHADRHRSSGARQRRLRLRCRGRRDRRSRKAHSRAAARRRRARAILRQQIRTDPAQLHRRRHQYRRRAIPGRHSRRGGADQIRTGVGDGVDRRDQRAALRPQRRRGDQPRPGNARCRQAPPRRIVLAVASECRARRPAPRQYPRHRRNRHRAERAPDRDGVRAGGRGALAAAGVLRVPGADGAGRRPGAAGARYRSGRGEDSA